MVWKILIKEKGEKGNDKVCGRWEVYLLWESFRW